MFIGIGTILFFLLLGGWPRSDAQQIWVPHLRDGLIVAKVGIRATREPSFPPTR
jgi:hypothetical protein